MKKNLLVLLTAFPMIISAQLSIKDTVIHWHTFRYVLNSNNTMKQSTSVPYDTVSVLFHGYVLENEYLKMILVPEFGGRILSMIYKPTEHEQLYQNPVGAPYGINQGWFYYDWLMVYGGIFPTLTEPEHGKGWLLPWEFKILKNTADTVRCSMSWCDTVLCKKSNPNTWKYGLTNIKCDYMLTLVKGASALEADVILHNDANVALNYEYWTCLTLTPGSQPGNPKTTSGAEIITSTTKVKIPSWYPDIASQEKGIPGQNGIYSFNKLKYWTNWTNDGIAYAWDDKKSNYWGVINHDNEEGFIRLSDNVITPGIKMWAWGYKQNQNLPNPFSDPTNVRRPYIELWAGHSAEFFTPAHFDKNSVKKWKEIYVPTIGLGNVTSASSEVIANLKINNTDAVKTVSLNFTTTRPKNNYQVAIEIKGQNPQSLLIQSITPDPKNGNRINVNLPLNYTWTTGDSIICKILNTDVGNYLTAAVSLNGITTGIKGQQETPSEFSLSQNYPNPFNPETIISYSIAKDGLVELNIYDILGRKVATIVNRYESAGSHKIAFNALEYKLTSGVYLYILRSAGNVQTRKLTLIK